MPHIPTHLSCHDKNAVTFGKKYKSWSYLLWSFLHPPCTSSLWDPNNFHNTLFSHILILCSSPSVRDQVFYPYITTCKRRMWIYFIAGNVSLMKWMPNKSPLYFNLYIFVEQTWWQKILDQTVPGIPWVQSYINFIMNTTLELCHTSKGLITHLYVVIPLCILFIYLFIYVHIVTW
jgi:hypothetical protein